MNSPAPNLTGKASWAIAKREREPSDFLPFARHADAHSIVTDDGALLSVIRLDGMAFETADRGDLNDAHEKLNSVLRNSADERVSWVAHTLRLRSDLYPGGLFR